ncbi:hypothetical protein Bbelb_096110 [Branchiostoma belcheri]|nr:hypothetical protein Bbelb_096110 [Branchiostoma belcheri]
MDAAAPSNGRGIVGLHKRQTGWTGLPAVSYRRNAKQELRGDPPVVKRRGSVLVSPLLVTRGTDAGDRRDVIHSAKHLIVIPASCPLRFRCLQFRFLRRMRQVRASWWRLAASRAAPLFFPTSICRQISRKDQLGDDVKLDVRRFSRRLPWGRPHVARRTLGTDDSVTADESSCTAWPKMQRTVSNFALANVGKCKQRRDDFAAEGVFAVERRFRAPTTAKTPSAAKSSLRGIYYYSRRSQNRYSYFPRTVRDWNELPQALPEIPEADKFKKAVLLHLRSI